VTRAQHRSEPEPHQAHIWLSLKYSSDCRPCCVPRYRLQRICWHSWMAFDSAPSGFGWSMDSSPQAFCSEVQSKAALSNVQTRSNPHTTCR